MAKQWHLPGPSPASSFSASSGSTTPPSPACDLSPRTPFLSFHCLHFPPFLLSRMAGPPLLPHFYLAVPCSRPLSVLLSPWVALLWNHYSCREFMVSHWQSFLLPLFHQYPCILTWHSLFLLPLQILLSPVSIPTHPTAASALTTLFFTLLHSSPRFAFQTYSSLASS